MFNNIYNNKRVLITGHTGFKGSWLALWLSQLGAELTGYSLQPPTKPNHFNLLDVSIDSIIGDVRDAEKIGHVFKERQPEIVFHLAAQPIVRLSYLDPVETFSSNIMGTVNVFQAAKECAAVRAVVNVTSDKCYKNTEGAGSYKEVDRLGGYDPYSASKSCSEIITSCWRNSFFNPNSYSVSHSTLLASARAGNVIGGGDWGVDRLVPDIVRAVSNNEIVKIRNPNSTRPWQHVLEPLSGYLLLGQRLLEGEREFSDAWNFGPTDDQGVTVGEIVNSMKNVWSKVDHEMDKNTDHPHETNALTLDSSKARDRLQWIPVWGGAEAVEKTALWYRAFYDFGEVVSSRDIECYCADARRKGMAWANT